MSRFRLFRVTVLAILAFAPQVARGATEPPSDPVESPDASAQPQADATPVVESAPEVGGETEEASEAVGAAVPPRAGSVDPTAARARDARRRYEATHVSFDEVQLHQFPTGIVMARWIEPRKGTNGERLEGAAYYEYVGRSDLADTYRKRKKIKWALIGTGAAVAVAGIVPGAVLFDKGFDPTFGCDSEYDPDANQIQYDEACVAANERMLAPGIGLLVMGGVGSLVVVAGAIIDPNPVKGDEFIQLGHEYNRRLRQRLGLGPLGSAARSRRALAQHVRLNVTADWTGAGLRVSGRF